MPVLEDLANLCAPLGEIGKGYLIVHFERFRRTKERLLQSAPLDTGACVLDVGAHWLHQSLLYAADGYRVTALDLPETFRVPELRALAARHSIRLLSNPDLEHPSALAEIESDTFDLVLFTEIIEHLTFNPVVMWREIHRVMRRGARIIVTTPNYYALRSRLRQWWRATRLSGAGISVDELLSVPTFGHHWKEYSRRELLRYFALLSPDFSCGRFAYTEEYSQALSRRRSGPVIAAIEHAVPILRPDLYLEVELARKDKGIVVEPHW